MSGGMAEARSAARVVEEALDAAIALHQKVRALDLEPVAAAAAAVAGA